MEQPSESSKGEGVERSEASSSCEQYKLFKPDSGGSSGSSRESKPNNFSLRSSVLGSSLASSSSSTNNSCSSSADSQNKSFVLNPPRLSNPFTKQTDEEKEKDKDAEPVNTENKSEQKSPVKESKSTCSGDGGGSSKVSFVPLGWGSGSGVSTSSSVSSSQVSSTPAFGSFVFGQNLREKVEGAKNTESQTEVSSTTDGHDVQNNEEEPKANGTTSEMLFSSAVKSESGDNKPSESSKTLSEAAREYEEARSVKRKFELVQLITGEEHEQNVLQMNCKLFAYDKISSGWQERGRGLLRLNDSTPVASRLIIRAHGSLRVLINTKVWGEMVVQRASPKSLRITAMDSSEIVKVFLISASQTEMDELQRYLESRVRKSDKNCGGCNNSVHSKKVKTDESS